jgi:hypothetical protein
MTQFTTTIPRRASGELDVYTGLLCAAFLVLAAGAFLLASKNIQHSESRPNAGDGGIFTLVPKP